MQNLLLSLICASVHKASDVHLCEAFLGGSKHNFTLKCLKVPDQFDGCKYTQLYAAVCKHMMVPLGLFRESLIEKQPYIYANPPQDTVVRKGDQVYVGFPHSTVAEEMACAKGAKEFEAGNEKFELDVITGNEQM